LTDQVCQQGLSNTNLRVSNLCVTLCCPTHTIKFLVVVYYDEIKREINRILTYECRCNERRRVKSEGSTRLVYTGLRGGLEHLKIETRLRGERFESVKGECVIWNL